MREFSTKEFKGMKHQDLRPIIDEFYRNKMQKHHVINKETGMKIEFNNTGRKKSLHYLTKEKAIIIKNLPALLREARIIGVEEPKKKHNAEKVIVFLATCKVDGRIMDIRIITMKKYDGLFQYELYDNKVKENVS